MTSQGSNVRMIIGRKACGSIQHRADTRVYCEVKQIREDPNKFVQGSQPGYMRKAVAEFQNVEIHSVLQVIADFTVITPLPAIPFRKSNLAPEGRTVGSSAGQFTKAVFGQAEER